MDPGSDAVELSNRESLPMKEHQLLFELGVEEIPAGYIEPLLEQLGAGLRSRLEEFRLGADEIKTAGSPRRLTVWASGVPEKQSTESDEVVGPPAHVAYDEENKPTKAAIGFARAQGVDPERLRVKDSGKGPYVVASVERGGEPAIKLLPDILADTVKSMDSPKSMRWPVPDGNGEARSRPLSFARPIRRLTALLGEEVIPVALAGLKAGRVTAGHPFLRPDEIELQTASFAEYSEKLEEAFVIVENDRRREIIRQQVMDSGSGGGMAEISEELLEEVAGLVEYPCALAGEFDAGFLAVPDCVVVAAMTKHQRYFPTRDAEGRLVNKFTVVSNRTARQEETVREGNERVLKARLADARFFWDEDRRIPLQERVEMLQDVVYLAGLGNNLHRTQRIERLAVAAAGMMGVDTACLAHLKEAARLCKADLLTGLVGEFPSLQGLVGEELALQEGQPGPVARAIGEHYMPVSADGPPPASVAGTVLSLADKTDAVICCYALDYTPDGSQDPFAMRRNAIGILKILETGELDIRLCDLLNHAKDTLQQQAEELGRRELEADIATVLAFFRDRLYHEALDRGFRHDMARAVLSVGFDRPAEEEGLNHNPLRFWRRLNALDQCARTKWWPELVEVVDRTYRIQKDLDSLPEVDPALLQEPEETLLAELLSANGDEIRAFFSKGLYAEAAEKYCDLFAGPVHRFFEEVFVNVEDEKLRRARKGLCGRIYTLFAGYMADLYLIETAGDS